MVVPVPVVLQKENVKTLAARALRPHRQARCPAPRRVLGAGPLPPGRRGLRHSFSDEPRAAGGSARNDAAIRARRRRERAGASRPRSPSASTRSSSSERTTRSASTTWLHDNGYAHPRRRRGAAPPVRARRDEVLRGQGRPAKVTLHERARATLSPLRFHYDSDAFALPVRLGLLNSAGTQDLIVHILARGQRYEVANYDNVAIPTNLDVADAASAAVRRVLRGALRPHGGGPPARRRHRVRVGRCELRPLPRPPRSTATTSRALGADVFPRRRERPPAAASCSPGSTPATAGRARRRSRLPRRAAHHRRTRGARRSAASSSAERSRARPTTSRRAT